MHIKQHIRIFFIGLIVILNSLLLGGELYVYDTAMLYNNNYYLVPEIKIDFQQLDEEFESGDTLKLRLWNQLENNSDLNWRLNDDLTIEGTAGKYFSLQSILRQNNDNELLLIVTKKKGLLELIRQNTRIFDSDSTHEKIGRNAFLRIKGLQFVPFEKDEVDKHAMEYSKNSNVWKNLNKYELLIGKTSLNIVSPRFLMRKLGQKHNINISIQSGKYPTIGESNAIKLFFSSPGLEWVPEPLGLVGIHQKNEVKGSIKFNTTIKKDTLILVPQDKIIPNSNYSISNIRVKCTLSKEQNPIELSVHMGANLSGNFNSITGQPRVVLLSGTNNKISLINPQVSLLNGSQNFIISDTSLIQIGFQIKNELQLFGDTLNKIQISIPSNNELFWSNQGTEEAIREKTSKDKKSIYLSYSCDNTDCITENVIVQPPPKSIAPFNFNYFIPGLNQSGNDTIDSHISFSHPLMSMENVKYVNVNSDRTSLSAIKLIEDQEFSSIPINSTIIIKIHETGFEFDNNESNLARIEYPIEHLELINARANRNEIAISFRLVNKLFPGQELLITGLPISEYNYSQNNGLTYSIGKDLISKDNTSIRIFEFDVSMDQNVEIIQQIKKESILTALPPIDISIRGDGPTFNKNEIIIIELPSDVGKWSKKSNIAVTNNSEYSILNIDNKNIKIIVKKDLYNHSETSVSGLSILTDQSEFLDQRIKVYLESDSSFSAVSDNYISQSYPIINSVDQQRFFMDDTTWGLYTMRINTRALKKIFKSGNTISIGFDNSEIQWDSSVLFGSLKLNKAANKAFLNEISYMNNLCIFTLKDSIPSETILEITGLKILPTESIPKNSFQLKLSLDDGKTYCALDSYSKIIRPSNAINEKIERQIQETTYAFKRGKEWRIEINVNPEDLRWDKTKNKRIKTIHRDIKNKARINVDPRSIGSDFTFIDRSNLRLKVEHSFGSISQDLNISGKDGDTKIIGIKGFGFLGNVQLLKEKDDILQLYVPTPFGEKLILNNTDIKYGWSLNVLNKDKSKELVIAIKIPSIIHPEKERPIGSKDLVLYGNDDILIRRPLIDDFPFTKESNVNHAKSSILKSVKWIQRLHESTNPKGGNWKTWYYLAWAKRNARDIDETLKLLTTLKDELEDDRLTRLVRNTWEKDIEKAKQKGYDPSNFHKDYQYPDNLNIYSREKSRIAQAEKLFEIGQYIATDSLLLSILNVVSHKGYNEYIRSLECVTRYNLARVAIKLSDIEYISFKSSYPYKQLMKAKSLYKDFPFLEDQRPALLDSIIRYRQVVKNEVNKDRKIIKLPVQRGTIKDEPSDSKIVFSYKYDNKYTVSISGRKKGMDDGHSVRIASLEHEDSIEYSDVNTKVNFNRNIRLSKGGEYTIKFSPDKESTWNVAVLFLLTAILATLY